MARVTERIHEEAQLRGLDPSEFAASIQWIMNEVGTLANEEWASSLAEARRRTGTTPLRIARWEDSGKDHSTWPGFSTAAREIAEEMPELGLFDEGEDFAGRLWAILSMDRPKMPKKYDAEILRRAEELCWSRAVPKALVDDVEAAKGIMERFRLAIVEVEAVNARSFRILFEVQMPMADSRYEAYYNLTRSDLSKRYGVSVNGSSILFDGI